ncbi:MAG: carbamoyl-phosphate synthase large subunit, partial [Candidatus Lokiarchaeota archaeon]|nr:carbamoyl-phosphate synthase large subunit [Candidatus Lokiarchaeota archaeon]
MPKRTDISSILVIGAGPIVIGQACEFDYSGTQACKALREDGYRVILVNSNPATIMTDPAVADKTYIEPVIPEIIKKIILKEKPDAILPTIGGQTGLNAAVAVAQDGFLDKLGVELIGADIEAIKKAEDRQGFRDAMDRIGLAMTRSGYARSLEDTLAIVRDMPFPVIIRPSYTLGGTGGSIAYNLDEFTDLVAKGLAASMVGEVMIEQSVLGWKEYELEVMKDTRDNVIIICSIENIDPMGIHTGDSITVAPQQTLSDREYQRLRDMSIAIIREIGVSTGGSNIQFAVNPENGEVLVIEMNPRVSRSSALASKATGFPIAKIAAKLAVGYSLDEIPNDITRSTPASFEPAIDYVVTKIPRFAFEKFRTSSPDLGVQMKSVGETMSIGRTFKESFQKAIRGLEIQKFGFDGMFFSYQRIRDAEKEGRTLGEMLGSAGEGMRETLRQHLASRHYNRLFYLKDALMLGFELDELYERTRIDKWFLLNLKELVDIEMYYRGKRIGDLVREDVSLLKEYGFSDYQIGAMTGTSEDEARRRRLGLGIAAVYKIVDTCAAEFEAKTPYYYSTYDEENEIRPGTAKRVVILGGGPNRIGQGIEFDYMCVRASFSLQELGYETVMVNSNPETVSTDYDVSDVLFFDPLTFEDVMSIIDRTAPEGVIVQLGGQTPLNLAGQLAGAGVPILGTSAESIAQAEDRQQFKRILDRHGFKQPPNDTALSLDEAVAIARRIGYPVLVRPSYVLGGRAMEIVYEEGDLETYIRFAMEASPDQPILIDKYLEKAVEVDVDCICDGTEVRICGIMEHIE